jgi:Protein of unknown function (DUF2752)
MMNYRSERLSARNRVTRGLLGATAVLALVAIFALTPDEMPLSSCLFHDLTGYSCLTCGLTRSLHACSHGYLSASLRFHLLGPFLFVGIVLSSTLWISQALAGKTVRLDPELNIRGSLLLFAVLWSAYGVIRIVTEYLA